MDLTQDNFDSISKELRHLAATTQLKWGHIQNDDYDNELAGVCNIFEAVSLDDFKAKISAFDEDHRNYYLRRWFSVRCAECDEYLFYKNEGVSHNPNKYDKKWDIQINNSYIFDVKSTVIPHCFKHYADSVLKDPMGIIEFYYWYQSKERRYDKQNRLFVVHFSQIDPKRDLKLFCGWGSKEFVFARFVREIASIEFMTFSKKTVGVIFLVETEPKVLKYKIAGLDSDLLSIPR